MQVSAACIRCMADRQEERIQRRTDLDEQIKAKYMKAVLRVIGESKDGTSAPELVEEISKVYESFFGKEQEYTKIKYEHNEKMMFAEQEIQSNIERAEDPLAQAILYARTGNYIDYGAMDVVDEGILKELIQKAAQETLDAENYHSFRQDLEQAKTLVYVTDNCGEIVLDKVLIQEMQKQYPALQIAVLVRGREALNDATIEDAEQVGLMKLVPVVGNGTGIAGTVLEKITEEARKLLKEADVILAKGQGNFESMYGCGLNVYYLFLCKCDWFVKRFGLTKNAGVFLREGEYHEAGY